MDKNTFWELIEKTFDPNTEQHFLNISNALAQLDMEQICRFNQYVALYSSLSESPATYIACKLLNGSASDDTELYFRLWLIAQGRDVFLETLKNPDKLAEINIEAEYYDFEMLMGAGCIALAENIDDLDEIMQRYAFTDEEEEEIAAEIATDMDWTEDEDSLWAQAPVRAPKLFAKYHNKADAFNKTAEDISQKFMELLDITALDYTESPDQVTAHILKALEDAGLRAADSSPEEETER